MPRSLVCCLWLLGCSSGSEPPEPSATGCEDCGEPTTCAEPFCDEEAGECDPGYLVADLDDPTPGDCQTLVCPGDAAEPTAVADDDDLPPDEGLACGAPACTGGVPGTAPLPAGSPCGEQSGVCDGVGTTSDTCLRCYDTEPVPSDVDAGCTRARPFCYTDDTLPKGACFALTEWDETWGGLTIGTDGLTVANLDTVNHHARSAVVVNAGTYYWEITATTGDPKINDGGIGVLNPEMDELDRWIGDSATGLSFGYGPYNTVFYTGWTEVAFPSGPPPQSSAMTAGWTYMFALDMDAGTLWIGNEGVWFGGGDPAKGLNPTVTGIPGRIQAGVTLYDEHSNTFEANFMGPFQFPVPDGFRRGLF